MRAQAPQILYETDEITLTLDRRAERTVLDCDEAKISLDACKATGRVMLGSTQRRVKAVERHPSGRKESQFRWSDIACGTRHAFQRPLEAHIGVGILLDQIRQPRRRECAPDRNTEFAQEIQIEMEVSGADDSRMVIAVNGLVFTRQT